MIIIRCLSALLYYVASAVKCMVLFIKMNIQMPQGLFCSFVLSLADVDPHLMMEDESLVWISNDVVIVLQHQNEKIPLRWVIQICPFTHADMFPASQKLFLVYIVVAVICSHWNHIICALRPHCSSQKGKQIF